MISSIRYQQMRISSSKNSDLTQLEFIDRNQSIQEFYTKRDHHLSSGFNPDNSSQIYSHRLTVVSPFSQFPRKKSYLINSDFLQNNVDISLKELEKYSESQLLKLTILILQKQAIDRSKHDIKLLKKSTSNIKFFEDLMKVKGEDIHDLLCKNMNYKHMTKGETVIREGSYGNIFFIILKGKVAILKQEIRNESPDRRGSKSPLRRNLSRMKSQGQILKNSSDKEIENIEIKVLQTGESFGELALLENRPRLATVVCKEDTHFAIIDKNLFDNVLKEYEKHKLYQQIEFLSNLKLFEKWSFNSVKSLQLSCEEIFFKRSMSIYNEGDISENFYIVKSGEFQVYKKFKIKEKNNEKYKVAKLELSILIMGGFFGEEELIKKCPRQFSIICLKDGHLIQINKREFFKKILIDLNSKQYIINYIKNKRIWREEKLKKFVFYNKKENELLNNLENYKEKLGDLKYNDFIKIFTNDIELEEPKNNMNLRKKITKIFEDSNSTKKAFHFVNLFLENRLKQTEYKGKDSKLFDYLLNLNNKQNMIGKKIFLNSSPKLLNSERKAFSLDLKSKLNNFSIPIQDNNYAHSFRNNKQSENINSIIQMPLTERPNLSRLIENKQNFDKNIRKRSQSLAILSNNNKDKKITSKNQKRPGNSPKEKELNLNLLPLKYYSKQIKNESIKLTRSKSGWEHKINFLEFY